MNTKSIIFTIVIAVIAHITAQFIYDKYFAEKAAS